ncbi:hypothetical protein FBU31_000600, partial [Coemansia sp. 'formosensis']
MFKTTVSFFALAALACAAAVPHPQGIHAAPIRAGSVVHMAAAGADADALILGDVISDVFAASLTTVDAVATEIVTAHVTPVVTIVVTTPSPTPSSSSCAHSATPYGVAPVVPPPASSSSAAPTASSVASSSALPATTE